MRKGARLRRVVMLGATVAAGLACNGREPPQGSREGGASTGVALKLSRTPEGQFREGAVERIQEALRERGLLTEKVEPGDLDVPTSAALRKLQEQRDLPLTGMPDRATVEALGLDPESLYQRREIPEAQEQQRPAVLRETPEDGGP